MKKTATWIMWIAFALFMIDWGVMGVKLLDGRSDFQIEAYIGQLCFAVMMVCVILRAIGSRCPYCGKRILDNGEYCPHCGKKLQK